MISIAVCDDDLLECCALAEKISTLLGFKQLEYDIRQYGSGEELMKAPIAFDLIFLDIRMKTMNGLEVAEELRRRGKPFILVFVTLSEDYVYEAFDVEAFHYLLKPIDHEKLAKVMNSAMTKLNVRQDGFIIVHKNRQKIKVALEDIIYLEITGRVTKIHCQDYEVEYYEQISTLEQKLKGQDFFRCHKSYLVHFKNVVSFDKHEIVLENGERVLMSKRRYQEFTKGMMRYLKKAGGIL